MNYAYVIFQMQVNIYLLLFGQLLSSIFCIPGAMLGTNDSITDKTLLSPWVQSRVTVREKI